MAISSVPAFSSEQTFFLTETTDIPLESDPHVYVQGVGQSQWFWAEVPGHAVNSSGPNYLIIWSVSDGLTSATNSPILAAGEYRLAGKQEGPQAWLNRSVQGVPPRSAKNALEAPINSLSPALAIKLIPANDAEVGVNECSVSPAGNNYVFHFSVDAENAGLAWIESSQDQLDWQRISSYLRQPPYDATLIPEKINAHGAYLRAVAQDILGNSATCDPIFISHK